ncbi:MAG: hypothetical protein ACTSUN_02855 [Promethearchaeota archaeon]
MLNQKELILISNKKSSSFFAIEAIAMALLVRWNEILISALKI